MKKVLMVTFLLFSFVGCVNSTAFEEFTGMVFGRVGQDSVSAARFGLDSESFNFHEMVLVPRSGGYYSYGKVVRKEREDMVTVEFHKASKRLKSTLLGKMPWSPILNYN